MGGRVRLECGGIASMMGLTSLYEEEEAPQLCLQCTRHSKKEAHCSAGEGSH